MLRISVQPECGRRHVRPTARELGELVRGLGGEHDRFLVVQQVPDLPDVFIQVWHEAGGDYTLEHRDGAPGRHFQVVVPGPEPVIAAMTGWAAGDAGWGGALAWQALDLASAGPPPPELPGPQRELLEARVRLAIAAGYATRAGLAELAEEYLATAGSRPVSPQQAAALADGLWLERVREQEHWQGETDPERLTRAFAALEGTGIVAREDFACCRACGMAEIGAEASPGARGFVFFHHQSTERAAAGAGLTLHYGGLDDTAGTAAAVGRQVVAALGQAGLPTRWDGDPVRAIEVTPLDWRKRLVG